MEYSRWAGLLLCVTALLCGGPTAASEDAKYDRITATNLYLASIAERRWADALPPAQYLLDLAREENAGSQQLAEALIRVGGMQFAVQDYASAEENFIEALALIEQQEGPISRSLEEPLGWLGYTLNALERHDEAIPVFERALLVSQRYNGLFDLSQRTLRYHLGNSLSELGRGAEAEQQFLYILRMAEQAYGAEDIRLAETMNFVGGWYTYWGIFEAGRQLYRRAIELIETKGSATDERLVSPLRSLGRSYLRELLFANVGHILVRADGTIARPLRRHRLPAEGEKAMLRAVAVMETAENRNPNTFRSALIDAGDWFLLKNEVPKALEFYRRAFNEPVVITVGTAATGNPLSQPAQIHYIRPPLSRRFLNRPADRVIERSLVVEFTVTRDGTVADARIVESDASERMERETLSAIRNALYRPRFENGEPVDTENVRHRQTFRDLD